MSEQAPPEQPRCPRCGQYSVQVDHATWQRRLSVGAYRVWCIMCGLSQWVDS